MKEIEVEITKNAFDVVVVKCCASCAYREIDVLSGHRKCYRHDKNVDRYNVCENWKMNRGARVAGVGGGKVKQKRYLDFAMNIRLREQEALAAGTMDKSDQMQVALMRRKYELFYVAQIYY